MTATNDLTTPPVVPAWPSGLPGPIDTPQGTLLPPPLASAVHERLLRLDAYPGLCGMQLRELDGVRAAEGAAAIDACEAACRERIAQARAETVREFPWLEVLAGAGAGVVIGLVVGLATGIGAR